ncbi:family 43 glycosylhydrolase [Paenarthrobacter aromaticivorans]|uniref:family 43 glycosylhydrolase n=1 Tax=Paenarthrobacter aromaticivorans TaxID=2849150 RepID=UPI003A7FB27F
MTALTNPILPGFSPDPSIVRVDDWYYLANSSFEWFPAVPIHRSKDLQTWEFAGSFRGHEDSLGLQGIQDSGGVWAPSLSWADGTFWLVFTVVTGFGGPHKDMDTYVTRAPEVSGPWTTPCRVTTTGFDPSLFHHEGRHWLLNMEWDHRPNARGRFAGINLQELDPDGTTTSSEPRTIHRRKELIEGPNIYFFDGFFYLMLAEGGTGSNHGIAMMRSRDLFGPYAEDPHGPVLTSRDKPTHALQKAGHGEIVVDQDGDPFLVHLASRWLEKKGRQYSILGRETCVQRLTRTDDQWLRLENGGWHPAIRVKGPTPPAPPTAELVPTPRDAQGKAESESSFSGNDGDVATVSWPWNTLRRPAHQDWASLTQRPGWLRLRGGTSTDSLRDQSLVARRLTSTSLDVSVLIEASPKNYGQSAGLIFYYNTDSYFYLRTTVAEADGRLTAGDPQYEKVLEIYEKDPVTGLQAHDRVVVPADTPLRLIASLRDHSLQFSWSHPYGRESLIGPLLNSLNLSDDHGNKLRFTGAFVGVTAQDLRDRTFTADFHEFTYSPWTPSITSSSLPPSNPFRRCTTRGPGSD